MWIVFVWASFNIKFWQNPPYRCGTVRICVYATAVENEWIEKQMKTNIEKRRRERCGKRQLRKVLSVDCFYVCSVSVNLSMRMNECVCVCVDIVCKWRDEPCLTAGDDCTLFQCENILNSPVNLINYVTHTLVLPRTLAHSIGSISSRHNCIKNLRLTRNSKLIRYEYVELLWYFVCWAFWCAWNSILLHWLVRRCSS